MFMNISENAAIRGHLNLMSNLRRAVGLHWPHHNTLGKLLYLFSTCFRLKKSILGELTGDGDWWSEVKWWQMAARHMAMGDSDGRSIAQCRESTQIESRYSPTATPTHPLATLSLYSSDANISIPNLLSIIISCFQLCNKCPEFPPQMEVPGGFYCNFTFPLTHHKTRLCKVAHYGEVDSSFERLIQTL